MKYEMNKMKRSFAIRFLIRFEFIFILNSFKNKKKLVNIIKVKIIEFKIKRLHPYLFLLLINY
jgi:hypothetical protein